VTRARAREKEREGKQIAIKLRALSHRIRSEHHAARRRKLGVIIFQIVQRDSADDRSTCQVCESGNPSRVRV